MSSRHLPIRLGAPGEEISKKDLHAVIQRFKHLNQGRLQRIREFLQPRQHDFLNLLPLLFHQNHPLLPGFVSLETPAGIPDYQPNRQAVDTAKQFSKGYTYKRKALRYYPVESIFLMGSVGSVAFSQKSDIDVWLCHPAALPDEQLAQLRAKAELIEKWAVSLKLEVHFFLLNSTQFSEGTNTPLSSESSGETQHYLLLEEFYRTSVYIAGKVPIWWLVPPEQESRYREYVSHLLENRFISENEVLDFGNLENMPQSEFVSATLWHIYKSLGSPHKSLLKLFLMESYAAEFPQPMWLCSNLKKAIYAGTYSLDSMDPYLLIYEKVDDYLSRLGAHERLNLARECLQIKVMGAITPQTDSKANAIHEAFMANIARRWHWPEELLPNLLQRKSWTIEKAGAQHGVIRDQLQQCLRMILKITGNPLDHPGQNHDLKLLSRKLSASLDLKPGKIEVLTTRAMVYTKPAAVTLQELPYSGGEAWKLFSGKLPTLQSSLAQAIKQADSLLELLCWIVVNGIYSRTLQAQMLTSGARQNGDGEVSRLLSQLHAFLSLHLPDKDTGLEIYSQPNRIKASFLLVNWGKELPIDNNPQLFMMSERSDPLSYGDNRYCFVINIQKVSVSSWGEVTFQEYQGLEGVFNCLSEVFNQTSKPLSAESLRIACYTRARGRSICMRLESLFEGLSSHFSSGPHAQNGRYLLAAQAGYCCFRIQNNSLSYYLLENSQALLQELSSTQAQFSPVHFDDFVLEQTFIPYLYQFNKPKRLQIFYHHSSKHIAFYIIDEKGALFVRQHSGANPQQILTHYYVFIKNLQLQTKLPETILIDCYEIQKNSAGVVSCHSVDIRQNDSALDLSVRITADRSQGHAIYCNQRKFAISNAQSYLEVKQYIMNFRKTHENYPCHITDIDIPCELLGISDFAQAQSVHYLQYKQKIEDKLNI
ncbi:class I adenylate cyclase [Methylomonas sp. HYX-M1]|uniref:class I adenylate cyclase n=1 Tax=Methylomonas sp. HYX-M1 TaxID=3139307 RepID=UPI00345C01DB